MRRALASAPLLDRAASVGPRRVNGEGLGAIAAATLQGCSYGLEAVRPPIGLGAVIGLALGVVVSVTTGVPLAPEAGLVLGALLGWLTSRDRS